MFWPTGRHRFGWYLEPACDYSFIVSLAALFFLAGCNNTRKPSNANFTKAINQYLAKRDDVCSSLGKTLPVDVTVPEQKKQYGIGQQLAALEEGASCIQPIR